MSGNRFFFHFYSNQMPIYRTKSFFLLEEDEEKGRPHNCFNGSQIDMFSLSCNFFVNHIIVRRASSQNTIINIKLEKVLLRLCQPYIFVTNAVSTSTHLICTNNGHSESEKNQQQRWPI